jgi:hypothetical protein
VVTASTASPAERGFTVTSSLEGTSAVPVRSRWTAAPKANASAISEVDFLIDGHLRWVEHGAPYYYGGDDNGKNAGFLITTWLTPGKRRFTVEAVDGAGQKASNTTTATVTAAPPPPSLLAGTWARTVTSADLKNVPNGPPPAAAGSSSSTGQERGSSIRWARAASASTPLRAE